MPLPVSPPVAPGRTETSGLRPVPTRAPQAPSADAARSHEAREDDAAAPNRPTPAALMQVLWQTTASARPGTDAIEVQIPDTAQATVQEVELHAALVTGLAASVGMLVWASRGGALLTSLLVSTPAWRGYDLLPVLRERKENRDWGETEADPASGADEADEDEAIGPAPRTPTTTDAAGTADQAPDLTP